VKPGGVIGVESRFFLGPVFFAFGFFNRVVEIRGTQRFAGRLRQGVKGGFDFFDDFGRYRAEEVELQPTAFFEKPAEVGLARGVHFTPHSGEELDLHMEIADGGGIPGEAVEEIVQAFEGFFLSSNGFEGSQGPVVGGVGAGADHSDEGADAFGGFAEIMQSLVLITVGQVREGLAKEI
jgi:hypothetical protein